MSPRLRSPGREHWPVGLKRRNRNGKAYYYWVDPRDNKEKSLKCPDDIKTAIQRANALNIQVQSILNQDFVLSSIDKQKTSEKSISMNDFAKIYMQKCIENKLKQNTLKSKKSIVKIIVGKLGKKKLNKISVSDVRELLDEKIDNNMARTAAVIRSTLIDIYKKAKAMGLVSREFIDPASVTENPKVRVKRSRLTLDEFLEINSIAKADRKRPWVYRSQLLALLSGQRLSDISRFRFRRTGDFNKMWLEWQDDQSKKTPYSYVEDDYLFVIQQKTQSMIKIPLALRLDSLDMCLGDVVNLCRDMVASRYLLHHVRNYGIAQRGSKANCQNISRQFKECRDKTQLSWPRKQPPTFHEIRSLSERLYKEQGINTQHLLGHKSEKMTAIYDDPRGAEWKVIREK